jgi:hypothetical protein
MKAKICSFFSKTFLTQAYRLKLGQKRLEKELREAIKRAEGNEEDIAYAKCLYDSELFNLYEEEEVLFTEALVKRAERLRVHIPAKPRWFHDTGFEENEDWQGMSEMYLTDKGINKLEEQIEKKKKWRRERWAFVVQCISAAVTVIGTMSGWIAFYLK